MTVPAEAFDVFSAHAEVVPGFRGLDSMLQGILRARGGSSPQSQIKFIRQSYSPRTRR